MIVLFSADRVHASITDLLTRYGDLHTVQADTRKASDIRLQQWEAPRSSDDCDACQDSRCPLGGANWRLCPKAS